MLSVVQANHVGDVVARRPTLVPPPMPHHLARAPMTVDVAFHHCPVAEPRGGEVLVAVAVVVVGPSPSHRVLVVLHVEAVLGHVRGVSPFAPGCANIAHQSLRFVVVHTTTTLPAMVVDLEAESLVAEEAAETEEQQARSRGEEERPPIKREGGVVDGLNILNVVDVHVLRDGNSLPLCILFAAACCNGCSDSDVVNLIRVLVAFEGLGGS
mmetsp:Transcript_43748/g.93664  ORF Transcript_43748/g.93664 Transcript_43748/m.93664 type:complete len:211 (-) Transcript_43748:1409-2041(-)